MPEPSVEIQLYTAYPAIDLIRWLVETYCQVSQIFVGAEESGIEENVLNEEWRMN
jgi:hypothetical protein